MASLNLNSVLFNQNENSLSSSNQFSKGTFLDQSSNRAFGRDMTNFGPKSETNLDQAKSYNLRSKGNTGMTLKRAQTAETSSVEKMSIEVGQKDTQSTSKGIVLEKEDDVDPIDYDQLNNPQYVTPYIKEIMHYVRATEEKFIPKAGYMSKIQNDINEKMRAILIDWLVDVHLKFKLLPETLFLTVNIIDRYLGLATIPRQKLQLVGVSAMLIATKYEEIYPPEVKDFEYVTDRAYTRAEILDMEGKILSTLSFNLTHTSAYRFLERYAKVAGFDEKSFSLARYLLELATIEYKMLKYIPSTMACAAVYLVNKIMKKEGWSDTMVKQAKYNESQIRPCAKDLCILLQNAGKGNLNAVKRKFSTTKLHEVAKIQLDKL